MLDSSITLFPDGNGTFQQDNDPKHTARLVQQRFADLNMPILRLPSQSPDMNPIENLWSILDKKCSMRKCNSEAQLYEVLAAAWNKLPADLLQRLVESMLNRIQAVIEADSGHTKY
jgi:transposase